MGEALQGVLGAARSANETIECTSTRGAEAEAEAANADLYVSQTVFPAACVVL